MARKTPNLNYAVNAVFYIGQLELAEQLSIFASNKKLGWSPDVKVAMTKKPAVLIEDSAFLTLKKQPASVLQGLLISLLTPVKEHDLFDLSDWLRDLDGVPLYLQQYWANNRVPKELDSLVAQSLNAKDDILANPAWPAHPRNAEPVEEDDDGVVEVKPVKTNFRAKKQTFVKPSGAKSVTLKGPQGRGKVSKQDVKYVKPEPEFVGAMDSSADVLVDAARRALEDKEMVKTASKTVWTRVHKAVEALLVEAGLELSTRTRPQRVETTDSKQAQVTYYLQNAADQHEFADFKANFLTDFDGLVADMEVIKGPNPESFRVWYQHA